jgi:hypothetical protein
MVVPNPKPEHMVQIDAFLTGRGTQKRGFDDGI